VNRLVEPVHRLFFIIIGRFGHKKPTFFTFLSLPQYSPFFMSKTSNFITN